MSTNMSRVQDAVEESTSTAEEHNSIVLQPFMPSCTIADRNTIEESGSAAADTKPDNDIVGELISTVSQLSPQPETTPVLDANMRVNHPPRFTAIRHQWFVSGAISELLDPKCQVGEQHCYPSSTLPLRLRGLIPPVNYGTVLFGAIFRSGYPVKQNFDFLAALGIKTVVVLVGNPGDDEEHMQYNAYLSQLGIDCHSFNVPANKGGKVQVDAGQIREIVNLVLDPTYWPLLIHCNQGKHRTGCVVACVEAALDNLLDVALENYSIYAGNKPRDADVRFIRDFDISESREMMRVYKRMVDGSFPWLCCRYGPDMDVSAGASTDGTLSTSLSEASTRSLPSDTDVPMEMTMSPLVRFDEATHNDPAGHEATMSEVAVDHQVAAQANNESDLAMTVQA